MKTSFLLSIAFGIVTVVVGGDRLVGARRRRCLGLDQLDRPATSSAARTPADFDVENYVGTSRVLGFTMIVAVVDVVLITAIATLGAFLYNLAAALLGGIEVTLAEDER